MSPRSEYLGHPYIDDGWRDSQYRRRVRWRGYVVVPEELSNVLFLQADNDETEGVLCKVFMDELPKPCNFGLGMEAP